MQYFLVVCRYAATQTSAAGDWWSSGHKIFSTRHEALELARNLANRNPNVDYAVWDCSPHD
jgi:hypothetical protein